MGYELHIGEWTARSKRRNGGMQFVLSTAFGCPTAMILSCKTRSQARRYGSRGRS